MQRNLVVQSSAADMVAFAEEVDPVPCPFAGLVAACSMGASVGRSFLFSSRVKGRNKWCAAEADWKR